MKLQKETIIKIGGEGGSIAIYRMEKESESGWRYGLSTFDSSDPDEPPHSSDKTAASREEALQMLDRYSWAKLYPLEIHADFRQVCRDAVRQRLGRAAQNKDMRDRWREALGASPRKPLERRSN